MQLRSPFQPARQSRGSSADRLGRWAIRTGTGASQRHGTGALAAGPHGRWTIYAPATAHGTNAKPDWPQSKTEHTLRFFALAQDTWKAGHMRNLLSRIASGCALTLTSWSHGLRGVPTEVSPLTEYAKAVSDNSLVMINGNPVDHLRTEMASGMIDGASRYLDGERPADMQARSA